MIFQRVFKLNAFFLRRWSSRYACCSLDARPIYCCNKWRILSPSPRCCTFESKVGYEYKYDPNRKWDYSDRHMLQPINEIDIFKCQTAAELLSLASRKVQDQKITETDYVYIFNHLEDLVYDKELKNKCSWVPSRHDFIYLWLSVIKGVGDIVVSLVEGPEFQQVLTSLHSDIDNISIECLPFILTSLARLKVPVSSPIFVDGLNRILEKEEFSWDDLEFLGNVAIGNNRVLIVKHCNPKLKALLGKQDSVQNREHIFSMIRYLNKALRVYVPNKEFIKCFEIIESWTRQNSFNDCLTSIIVLELIYKTVIDYNRMHHSTKVFELFQNVSLCAIQDILENIDALPLNLYRYVLQYVSVVDKHLYRFQDLERRKASESVLNALYQKSVEHLSREDLTTNEFKDIVIVLTNNSGRDPEVINKVQEHILKALKNPKLDEFTFIEFVLAFLTANNPNVFINQEIYKLMGRQISEKFKNMEVNDMTDKIKIRNYKFLKTFSKTSSTNDELDVDLLGVQSEIMKDFHHYSFSIKKTCSTLINLLRVTSINLDRAVTNSLLNSVDIIHKGKKIDLKNLFKVLCDLELEFGDQVKELYPAFTQLRETTMKSLLNKCQTVYTIIGFIKLINHHLFYTRDKSINTSLYEEYLIELSQILAETSNQINLFDFEFLLFSHGTWFSGSNCSQELLKNLENFVVINKDNITIKNVGHLLKLMSECRYGPHSEVFKSACLEIVDRDFDRFGPYDQILAVLHMVECQIVPKKQISQIFTSKHFGKIDSYLQDNPLIQRVLVKKLKDLNRTVVLSYPELNISWIMSNRTGYTRRQEFASREQLIRMHEIEEIKRSLSQVLGGTQYFQQNAQLPYDYSVDFELYLDENGQPVGHDNSVYCKDSLQRVGLLYLTKRSFSQNGVQLKSGLVTKIKQLEMMGVHVVEIPYFEWQEVNVSIEGRQKYLWSKMQDISPNVVPAVNVLSISNEMMSAVGNIP